MRRISIVAPLVSSALLVGALASCAAGPEKNSDHAQASMGTMDMQAMCEKHKKMMSGKPAAEQQAMMQEHMKSMTPEMRQRMRAMHDRCK